MPTTGREGAWAEFVLDARWPVRPLEPIEASAHRRDASGKLVWQTITAAMYDLPAIGFTLSHGEYRTGSPQQNYADAVPLRSQTNVITVP